MTAAIQQAIPGTAQAAPFVKWVGGKRQILSELRARTPLTFGRYFEPFIGGGALFFNLAPRTALLSDTNDRLIRTYRAIRDDVGAVINCLIRYPYERDFFLRMRGVDIDQQSDVEVAAWFIYLNRAGFNGLYRVNRGGKFNVPFGRYTNPTICNPENLRACALTLASADLFTGDFEAAVDPAGRGDFVYFDPPYVPLSATSRFTAYQADGFGSDKQRRLRDLAVQLITRGVHVMISNSSAALVRELYGAPPFVIDGVSARRAINSKADRRGAVSELLITGVAS